MILILTNELDVGADWVVRELQVRSAPFLRLNTERLPQHRLTWSSATDDIRIETFWGERIQLASVEAVWYRRPERPFGQRPTPDSPEDVLNRQWRAFLDAIYLVPGLRWINHPFANYKAESKVHQLRAALNVGFAVPDSLVSNDPTTIRAFAVKRDTVVKALDAPLVLLGGAEEHFMFTSRLTREDLTNDEALAASPLIYQMRIEPRTDIRVTVVGDRVFAARAVGVTSQDWRLDADTVAFEPAELPSDVALKCAELVRRLGLRFGAIDLLLHGGDAFFLEINPNGEWGWLQAGGQNIAGAIVDELQGRGASEGA